MGKLKNASCDASYGKLNVSTHKSPNKLIIVSTYKPHNKLISVSANTSHNKLDG